MKIKEPELPCIDCICMPICKSQYLHVKNERDQKSTFSALGRVKVQQKCSILKRYMRLEGSTNNRLAAFHNFMNKTEEAYHDRKG